MRLLGRCTLLALLVAALHAVSSASGAAADAPSPGAVSLSSLPVSYFVMIDAGSTGSRAHVHEYRVDPAKPLPLVEESKNKKIKPGLSSYAKDPPAASKSIQDLLAFIKETVPESHWSRTPIHVQATAGLRSVTPQEAAEVLDVVRDDLMVSGFLFEPAWARIISGEQEGINGWMAVNYLLGVFDQPAPPGTDENTPPPASTGVVEMGGSSMQITFAPLEPSPEERKQLNEVRVAGYSYWLYTHSFLQYGLQAAEKLYQRLAIQEIEERGNPCYPPSFRHSSAGDFGRCTELLQAVVDKSVSCPATYTSCSFNGVYQPRIGAEQFLAIENFYYTAKFFGTAEQQDQTTPGEDNSAEAPALGNQLITGLRRKGAEFCNQDWGDLVSTYSKTPADELKAFCFSAAYQTVLLESGLGFGPGANLRVARTINGKGIDWEMGATILELMPKDPRQLEAQKRAEEAERRRAHVIVYDEFTGAPLPIGSRTGTVPDNLDVSPHDDWFCRSCMLYTFGFAAVVVLAFMGWKRYNGRRGDKAGSALQMTAYSQVGFNRV